jgi:hypothetical protein
MDILSLFLAILVFVLVAGVLWWAINALAGAFGLPPQIVVVLQVVLVIACLIALLDYTGILGGTGLHRPLIH